MYNTTSKLEEQRKRIDLLETLAEAIRELLANIRDADQHEDEEGNVFLDVLKVEKALELV